MSQGIKITLIVVVVLLLLAGAVYWFVFKSVDVNMEPLVKNEEVVFNDLGEKLYLRAMAWGVAGSNNEIIISESPINPADRKSEKGSDYIFYTTELYYKKLGEDTLLVYAEASSIGKEPENYSGKVKIVPVRLKTYDDSKEYAKNYKKYGLNKLSAYKE